MELAQAMVLRNVEAQAKAGAKALLLAEPAANRVFIAPRLVEEGSDIWERLVMEPNRRLRNLLDKHGVDLMFHCCGELEPWMVRDFTTLQPVLSEPRKQPQALGGRGTGAERDRALRQPAHEEFLLG